MKLLVSFLQICQWPTGTELRCGRTDGLTTLPKRAMRFVEIILVQLDLRGEVYQSVRNTSVVSRRVGKKKVVVGGDK